jgi:DNA-directed RNA polymerase subunit E'/Rpb7
MEVTLVLWLVGNAIVCCQIEVVEGVVTDIDEEGGTITIETEDGETLTVLVPDDFDFTVLKFKLAAMLKSEVRKKMAQLMQNG